MKDKENTHGKIEKTESETINGYIEQYEVLRMMYEKVEIICADIDDIFTEEEIGIIN